MAVQIRMLRPEEHPRLAGVGQFPKEGGGPDPAAVIVAAEDDQGQIVGFWCAFNAVHMEPLWVHESVRQSGIGVALWQELTTILKGMAVKNGFAMVHDEDAMTHLPLAMKLGFKRIPASVLFVDLSEKGGH